MPRTAHRSRCAPAIEALEARTFLSVMAPAADSSAGGTGVCDNAAIVAIENVYRVRPDTTSSLRVTFVCNSRAIIASSIRPADGYFTITSRSGL